jgi:hypothetical protein
VSTRRAVQAEARQPESPIVGGNLDAASLLAGPEALVILAPVILAFLMYLEVTFGDTRLTIR